MAEKIFDRETLLDLLVNFVPLFILVFFIVGYTVYDPFGFDPLISTLHYVLLVMPFLMLALLTYLSGKAISKADMSDVDVYVPGAATVDDAKPIEERME
ncbi:MAG: DUF6684 family protein [Haloplanus sp.]